MMESKFTFSNLKFYHLCARILIIRVGLVLIALLFSTFGMSQQSADSLIKVWHNKQLSNEDRLKALHEYTRHGKVLSNADTTLKYTQLLFDKAVEASDYRYQALAQLYTGLAIVAQNDLQKTRKYLIIADSLAQHSADEYVIARVQCAMGLLYSYIGEQEKGLKLCTDAYKSMDSMNHIEGIVHTSAGLLMAHALMNDNKGQFHYAKINVEYAEKLGKWTILGLAYHNLADVFLALNMGDDADYYHQKAIDFCQRAEFKSEEMNIYNHLATIEFTNGNFDKALSILYDVEDYYKKLDNQLSKELIQSRIIFILTKKEEYAAAALRIKEYRESEISTGLLSKFNNGLVDLSEGLLLAKEGKHNIAIPLFKKALIGFKGYGQSKSELWTHEALIYSYQKIENFRLATIHYNRRDSIKELMNKEDIKKNLQRFEIHRLEVNDSLAEVAAEEAEILAKENELKNKKRKNRIQYSLAVIAVLLIASTIAVLTRFQISVRLAQGLVFIFFILTFEFLLVVLDPWVDSVSNGEVGWKIGINTAIALVLFGIHQVSEKKLKNAILKADR